MAIQTLTAEQQRVMDETEAYLGKAFEDANSRLAAVGIETVPEFACRRCHCPQFQPSPTRPCGTPGCTHSFFQHNIPR